ncbi:MAG: hypothetical protein K5756_05100 [Clostridiales bacterium]|nr:hypothetical protein [Clostridiales bacterium]
MYLKTKYEQPRVVVVSDILRVEKRKTLFPCHSENTLTSSHPDKYIKIDKNSNTRRGIFPDRQEIFFARKKEDSEHKTITAVPTGLHSAK